MLFFYKNLIADILTWILNLLHSDNYRLQKFLIEDDKTILRSFSCWRLRFIHFPNNTLIKELSIRSPFTIRHVRHISTVTNETLLFVIKNNYLSINFLSSDKAKELFNLLSEEEKIKCLKIHSINQADKNSLWMYNIDPYSPEVLLKFEEDPIQRIYLNLLVEGEQYV